MTRADTPEDAEDEDDWDDDDREGDDDETELPEEMSDADYGEFLARELPGTEPSDAQRRRTGLQIAIALLLLLFLIATLQLTSVVHFW